MTEKSKIIIACAVTFAVSVLVTLGAMTIFDIGIGDKVFVSQTEYYEMKSLSNKYAPLDKVKTFLKENYYQELDDNELFIGMCKGMFEATGDPYTRYMTADEYQAMTEGYSGEFNGIGVTMSVSEDGYIEVVAVIDDSPAESAGIRDLDKIVKVNNVNYSGAELSKAAEAMRGEKGTHITITVNRGGVLHDYDLIRAPIPTASVRSKIMDGNIGYIRISSFKQNTAQQFKDALTEMENSKVAGLVIDLRSNGGGIVDQSVEIADMLMDEGTVVYTENGKGEREYYKSKMGRTMLEYVILVNGGTASASEILTAGVQGNGEGKVVGTQTYGKGITQTTWRMTNGAGIEITVTQYFAPDGSVIHKKGISPDVIVELEDSDIVDGVLINDRQLDKAIELLQE